MSELFHNLLFSSNEESGIYRQAMDFSESERLDFEIE